MLRHGFAAELLPQAAFARGGGGGEKVGARVLFGKSGLRITCGQQAAADVGIRADEGDALRCAREDLQARIGVFGKMAVDLPALGCVHGFRLCL